MIGKYQITLDGGQFVRGQSVSDYSDDGGLGSSSVNLNMLATPGVVYPISQPTTIRTAGGADPLDVFIASCEDTNTTGNYRLLLDKAAHFYTYDGTNITLDKTGSATYTQGRADMVYSGLGAYAAYASSNGDVTKWLVGTSIDETWWSATVGGTALGNTVPHPLLMFGSLLYIADGQYIHAFDGSTHQNAMLTLQPNEIIYSLGIEPGSGLIMIGVQTKGTINLGNVQNAKYYVHLWDGFSSTIRRRVPVDDLPTCMYSNAGQVIVGYGQNIGAWNGTGITFLRRLASNPAAKETLLYKHHITNIGRTLYYVDGVNAMAYGQIVPGVPAFWNAYQDSTNTISLLANVGGNNLGMAFNTSSTKSFVTMATLTAGTSTATIYTNNIDFPRPVFIRRMRVFTTGVTHTSAFGVGGIAIIDEKGVVNQPTVKTFIQPVNATTQYVFDFDFTSLKLQMAQPRVSMDTQAAGLVRVVLYYDIAE